MAVTVVVMAIFVLSCSETKKPERKTEVSKSSIVNKKKSKGKLYKPSELALLMRKMYSNMKQVGTQIHSGNIVSDSLLTGYEMIYSATPTNPEEIDDKFTGFARGWLSEVEMMRETPTVENYNNIMNACVHCHQSYCPGPISKINKLKITP